MPEWVRGLADWPWGPIIATIVGSGAIAALLGHILQGRRDAETRTRAAGLSALKAAQDLERFARLVASAVSSWHAHDPYNHGVNQTKPWPDLAQVPQLDWAGVDKDLTSRALGFPEEVAKGRELAAAWAENDDDEGLAEAIDQGLRLGLEAWLLARDLRSRYGYPASSSRINSDYDFVEWMSSEQKRRAAFRPSAPPIALG